MNLKETFKGKVVLITGHTGFKGTWLTAWLIKLGAQVVGVSNSLPSTPSHFEEAGLASMIKDVNADIRDFDSMDRIFKENNPDFVFHLAAQSLVKKSYENPIETYETNFIGTLNILEALRSYDQDCIAVLITSDKCYENVEWVWGYKETDPLGGPDPYSASKGAAELVIRSHIKSYFPSNSSKIRIASARAGNVIGGGDWALDRIIPDCVKSWSNNKIVKLRNPNATRPWQHVLEPLSGYLALSLRLIEDRDIHGESYNFGPPAHQDHSVGELVGRIGDYWKEATWQDVSDEYSGPSESGLLKLNCDKALHDLNWTSTWGFEETIKETALWYRYFYEQQNESILETTFGQIDSYVKDAQQLNHPWAL
jgi:CDP-glucose 4,6-dehydratase